MRWEPFRGLRRRLRSAVGASGIAHADARVQATGLLKPGWRGSAKVAVLTVVGDEFDAARRILGLTVNVPGTAYFVSALTTDHRYDVVLRKTADRSNIPAGEAVTSVVEDFRPAFLFLVGIAGGFQCRGTELGDVVVADFIDYSEFRKIVDGQRLVRHFPHDHPSLYIRESIADPLCTKPHWLGYVQTVRPTPGVPKAMIGNIVAGEKLLGDPTNAEQQALLADFDHALGVDMESMGFARAVFKARSSVHYNPQCSVIRGISDLVDVADNNAIRQLWRLYAAETAVAFARGVIEELLRAN